MSSYGQYFRAALTSQINLAVFAGMMLVGLISMNPFVFAAGIAGEAAWLMAAPLLPGFRHKADERAEKFRRIDESQAAHAALNGLDERAQRRYAAMEELVSQVRASYERIGGNSKILLDQIAGQMDALLPRYLKMLSTSQTFETYLRTADPGDLAQRITALEAEIASADERVAEIKKRQLSILEKRKETVGRARQDTDVLNAQLATFEDLARLLKEQTLTMRDPSEASAQIDSLVAGIEVTENTVHDLETNYAELFDRELADAEKKKLGS